MGGSGLQPVGVTVAVAAGGKLPPLAGTKFGGSNGTLVQVLGIGRKKFPHVPSAMVNIEVDGNPLTHAVANIGK